MLGLEWQSVDKGNWGVVAREARSGKAVGGAIALQGPKRTLESGKAAPGATSLGLWAQTFREDEELQLKLPKPVYSLAAAFALAAQAQSELRASLYLDLGQHGGVSQVYFCRLHNGVPITDGLFPKEKASDIALKAEGEGDVVFSNDQDLLPASTFIDLAWFAKATDKRSIVGPVPFNWAAAAVALTIVAILAGGGLIYKQHKIKQRKAEDARIAAENDPVPKYQLALAAQRARVGMDRAAVAKLFSDLMTQTPRSISGWRLMQIECTLEACNASWERQQGTFSDAKQERPSDKLLIPSVDEQGRISSTALATIKTLLPNKPVLADLPAELPKYDAYVLSTGNTLQKWANAGVPVQAIGVANSWPAVPGAGDIRLPGMLGKGDFVVTGANAVFGTEMISQLPPSVFIRKLVLRSAPDTLTFEMTGDFYVVK